MVAKATPSHVLTEAPAGWVTISDSRHKTGKVENWRATGRLQPDRDYVPVASRGKHRTVRYYDPAALDREDKRSASDWTAQIESEGWRLSGGPPVAAILVNKAVHKFGLSRNTIKRLVNEGKVAAWLRPTPMQSGRKPVVVSGRHLSRYIAGNPTRPGCGNGHAAPDDGEPVAKLAKEFGVADLVLRIWCTWKSHPALGRAVRSGIGEYEIPDVCTPRRRRWRGLRVSRADVAEIMRVTETRTVGGEHPGAWLTDHIFQRADGGLYFTESYITQNSARFGLKERTAYARLLHNRIKVIWPALASKGPDRWHKFVFPKADVDSLVDARAGKFDGGQWLSDGDLWNDTDGLWYSSRFIARAGRRPVQEMQKVLRRDGLAPRCKRIRWRSPKGLRWVVVHHESQVRPLLGIGSDQIGASNAQAKRKRGRPASQQTQEVYKFCHDMKATGMKATVIRKRAAELFGQARAPKEDSHVSLYAKRYKPLKNQGAQNSP